MSGHIPKRGQAPSPHRFPGETNVDAIARLAGERDAARQDVDRLRAELADTHDRWNTEYADVLAELEHCGAAGDALAAAALVVDEHWQDDCVTREQVECLLRTAQAWRSVRGDAPAPAEPPADPTRTSPASTGVGWVLTDPDVALPIHAWSPGLIRDELAAKLGIPGDDITVDCVAGQLRTPTVQVTLRMAELIADGAARGGSR